MEPFNGDFVQRHARAAAIYNDIYVLHIAGDGTGTVKEVEDNITITPGLTEQLIYYPKKTSLWGKLQSHYQWMKLSRDFIKKYISVHGQPDLVHVHIPIKAGIAALWIKRVLKIPYIVTEHWGIYNDVDVLNYSRRSSMFKRYTREVFKQASLFLSVSNYLAKSVNQLVCPCKYEIVPNTVDTSFFFQVSHDNPLFTFIHVSNMVPLKNAEGILRAFRLFSQGRTDVVLRMVGDTSPKIRKYARELGLLPASVVFEGEVPYTHVATLMQQADCFVMFSNIENSPAVIGEALCCGLPVIATDVGGIPELVNTDNSVLVLPGNEQQLVDAMGHMFTSRNEYDSVNIAKRAAETFSYPIIGKKLDDIYARYIPTGA